MDCEGAISHETLLHTITISLSQQQHAQRGEIMSGKHCPTRLEKEHVYKFESENSGAMFWVRVVALERILGKLSAAKSGGCAVVVRG